nr:Chain A, CLAVATA-like encoded peptide of Meloidogyne hapla - MhCLE4 [Meloidogyne hapla]
HEVPSGPNPSSN